MTKISVIIPVYNVGKFLRECLDSIVNQTFKDIEIICVNDGSTDNSLLILEEYAAKDKRIKIINQENKGAGAARNRGMKEAVGEYLYFMDSDDYADITMLDKLYRRINKKNSDICVCKNIYWDMNNQNICPKMHKSFSLLHLLKQIYYSNKTFNINNSYKNLFQICNIPLYTKLYNHEFIKRNGIYFQEIKTCSDVYFNFYSLACANSIVLLDEKLIMHRSGHVSITTDRAKSIECIFFAFNELETSLRKRGLLRKLEETYIKRREKCFKYELEQVDDTNMREYWKSQMDKVQEMPLDFYER